jgi:NADH dehydrogenase (ubiquinone) Fe-S protein 6
MSCGRRLVTSASVRPRFVVRAYSSTVPRLSENPIPVNDPTPRKPTANVSATNAQPTEEFGRQRHDSTLQEAPEVGERIRSMQAPNRATTWAASQQPREKAMVGPRFEQTIMETQVRIN